MDEAGDQSGDAVMEAVYGYSSQCFSEWFFYSDGSAPQAVGSTHEATTHHTLHRDNSGVRVKSIRHGAWEEVRG